MSDHRRWRVIQWLLGAALVGAAAWSLARNWGVLRTQQVVWDIRPSWLFGALLLMWASYVLQIEVWRRVVSGMGFPLRWLAAARVCTVSNLGKYVPGGIWTVTGAVVLARQEGVAAGAAIAAAILLQGLALASGVAVTAFLAPDAVAGLAPLVRGAVLLLGFVAIGATFLFSWAPGRRALQRLLPAAVSELPAVGLGILAVALIANTLVWGMTGLAFVWLGRGLIPASPVPWALATSVFTAAYLGGLIAVLAPAGLGPRESLLILLLQGPIGLKTAAALAVASRILLTLAELGFAIPFLGRGRATFDPSEDTPR